MRYCADAAGTGLQFDVVGRAATGFREKAGISPDWQKDIEEYYRRRGK